MYLKFVGSILAITDTEKVDIRQIEKYKEVHSISFFSQ